MLGHFLSLTVHAQPIPRSSGVGPAQASVTSFGDATKLMA